MQIYNCILIILSKIHKMDSSIKILLLLLIILPGFFYSLAQTLTSDKKISLRQYRTVQFISSTGLDPKRVIFMDNNDEILLACVNGNTRKNLKKLGLKFKESQITLMKLYRLLDENNGKLKTAFPVLDSIKTMKLRRISKNVSEKLFPRIKSAVKQLIDELKNQGCKNNSYSILFSYILDRLAWDEFDKLHLLDSIAITAETPFWDGKVWSFYPKRNFSCGTNTRTRNGIAISLNWSPYASDKTLKFWFDRKDIMQMLDDIASMGKVVNKQVLKAFARFGIFNKNGLLTIPVIEEKNSNHLYNSCQNIAEEIATNVNNELKSAGLVKDFGFKDYKQALVITYHEIIWDLMDKFEQEKVIHRPVVFSDPEKANDTDINDVVFIVRYSVD